MTVESNITGHHGLGGGKGHKPPPKKLDLTPDDPRWICLASNTLYWDIYLFLGDGQPTPADGVGGWTTVPRPGRTSGLYWPGSEPWALAVPIMLDNWIEDIDPPRPDRKKKAPKYLHDIKNDRRRKRAIKKWRRHRDKQYPTNVEDYTRQIVHLGQEDDRLGHPPMIRLYGRALPFWLNGETWVIEDIEWGDRMPGNFGGHARRQGMTITFRHKVEIGDFRIKREKARKGGDGGRQGHKKRYTVKAGDTLMSIAAKFYGDRSDWKKIAKANNIKNPRNLKVGRELVIP